MFVKYENTAGDFSLKAEQDGFIQIKFQHNQSVTSEITAYGNQEKNLRSLFFLLSEAIREFDQAVIKKA